MKNYSILFVVFISLISCKTFPPRYKDAQSRVVKDLIVDQEYKYAQSISNCKIITAAINNDTLEIEVEYTGGCEIHTFNLYFDEVLKKSMPPKATLFLEHKDNSDQCESMLTKTLKFNIKKLKEKSNEMYIYLVGYSHTLKY